MITPESCVIFLTLALGGPSANGWKATVVEDSRCPERAMCVWAGELIVNVEKTSNDDGPVRIVVDRFSHTDAKPGDWIAETVDRHTIRVCQLAGGAMTVLETTDHK